MIGNVSSWARLAVLILALAAPSPARAALTRAFVSCTDFSTGSLTNVQLGYPPEVNVAAISSDAVLRRFGDGLLYVVNRFGFDNIQVIDPANGYATVQQFSVGNGSNPTDIVVVSPTKGYVARYGSADLWIVNPQTGAHTGTISLAGFADLEDGLPEMHRLAIQGGRLFVTVQRLDRNNFFSPTDSSQVVVIDLATDTVMDMNAAPGIQGIPLPFQNPCTELVVDPSGVLLVGCCGAFGALDGGVAKINLMTFVAGSEITESTLGGDINDVAVFNPVRGFVVISDASFATLIKSYHRIAGTVTGTPFATPDFSIADIEVSDNGELWVCDRSIAAPGIRLFDAATGVAIQPNPMSTGLPPQDIELDHVISVDVPGPLAMTEASVALLASFPSPAAGLSRIVFRLSGPEAVTEPVGMRVIDLQGRVIWSRDLGRLGPGEHRVAWEGRTSSGEAVTPGVYVVLIRAGASVVATKVIRI